MNYSWILISSIGIILEIILVGTAGTLYPKIGSNEENSKNDGKTRLQKFIAVLLGWALFYLPFIFTAVGYIWFNINAEDMIASLLLSSIITILAAIVFIRIDKLRNPLKILEGAFLIFNPILYQFFLIFL